MEHIDAVRTHEYLEHAIIDHISSGVADYAPTSEFGPRTTIDYELVWLTSGSAHWERRDSGEAPLRLKPGTLLCCYPGERDHFSWDQHKASRHGYIHFGLVDPPQGFHLPRTRQLHGDEGLSHLLRFLTSSASSGAPLAVQHSCLRSCLQLMCHESATDSSPVHEQLQHPLIHELFEKIQQEWSRSKTLSLISTARLASLCDVSTTHLARICTQYLGMGPQALVRTIRLEQAITNLSRSNEAIHHIAETCGFSCPYHFSRTFKSEYGMSPRAMRRFIFAGNQRPQSKLLFVQHIIHATIPRKHTPQGA